MSVAPSKALPCGAGRQRGNHDDRTPFIASLPRPYCLTPVRVAARAFAGTRRGRRRVPRRRLRVRAANRFRAAPVRAAVPGTRRARDTGRANRALPRSARRARAGRLDLPITDRTGRAPARGDRGRPRAPGHAGMGRQHRRLARLSRRRRDDGSRARLDGAPGHRRRPPARRRTRRRRCGPGAVRGCGRGAAGGDLRHAARGRHRARSRAVTGHHLPVGATPGLLRRLAVTRAGPAFRQRGVGRLACGVASAYDAVVWLERS